VSDGNHEQQLPAQYYPQGYQPGVALAPISGQQNVAPYVPQPMGNSNPATYTKGDSTYMERSEVETEIF